MRIVVATDDSAEARQATVWLRDLPLPPDTSVYVMTVATLTDPPSDSRSLAAMREDLRIEASRAAERAAALLEQRWPRVQAVVAEGDARVEIVHVAEEHRADMVVVGARGLGGVQRALGGSTSLAVARYAPCPVAVVQGRPRALERVLVAVDDSPASRLAVDFLSRLALTAELQAIVVHVLPESSGPDAQATAERLLADVAAPLRCAVEPVVVAGDPAKEIVRVARERDVGLVVLGARGLRTLGRLFLGSVSEAVLHHAGRPVIVVRQRA
jgi:nucleotide-binding universal stress UspA family protein